MITPHAQALHPLRTAAPRDDEPRWADTTLAIQGVAAALAQLDARLSAELATLQAADIRHGERLAALADGRAPLRHDLYRRLTSRALWTAFVLPALFAVAAALAGELSWQQAAAVLLGGGSVFGAVEGARDVARAAGRTAA